MNQNQDGPGNRMQVNGAGAGESSAVAVEQRAAELARTEGRNHVIEGDRMRARDELNGPVRAPAPPEAAEPHIDALVSWDEPVDSSGRRAIRLPDAEEATIGEQLVEEGVEEADHQRRVSAVNQQDRETGRD
jgi:hypothetical protein